MKPILTVAICLLICGYHDILSTSALSSPSSPLPRICLSEYGYSQQTDEYTEKVYFTADSGFQTEDYYENNFVAKNGPDYTISEIITRVVFICESDLPVFWAFAQNLPKVTANSFAFFTENFRSLKTDDMTPFRAILSILDIDPDSFSYVPADIFWTFTCFTSDHQQEKSVTLRAPDSLTFQDLNLNRLHYMAPDDKMVLSVTRLDNSLSEEEADNNLISVDLSEARATAPNFYADGMQDRLFKNRTIFEDFEDPEPSDKLVEYGKEEVIYEGDVIQIFCVSLNAIYAAGAYVQVIWENGSVDVLEEVIFKRRNFKVYLDKEEIENHPIFGDDKLGYLVLTNLRFYLSQPIIADKDMRRVECVMPLWGEGGVDGWEKAEKELNVLVDDV